MDSSLYKSTTTSRGVHYNYYASPAQQGKPTLLFLHGFPSTAYDWRYFVPYFKDRGYGLIVPDMLGYGGTDKPTDPSLYVSSKVSKDLVDILDAEKIQQVVVIGHDWGAKAASRLANYYPERFLAYAFFAVPYVVPHSFSNFEQLLETMRQVNGYDTFGYWPFLSEDEADSVIKSHIDAFISVWYPADPILWKTNMAPLGALKATVLADFKAPLAPYVTEEYIKNWKELFFKNGFTAPTCWYKIMTNGMEGEDDKQVSPERLLPPKTAPLFFGAATKDYICVADVGKGLFQSELFTEHDVTIREFDADHWLVFSKANEICREVESWIERTVIKKASL